MPGKSTIKHKTCRALGVNLIGSPRAALTLSKRPNRPGQHGANRRQKISPFGEQLQETQKLKYFYGVSAKQLRRYYKKASMSRMQTNIALVQQLETRLDNMVYRMGFAVTRAEARQLVSHKAIMVNGSVINIPSYEVSASDEISVTEKAQQQLRVKNAVNIASQLGISEWLSVDLKKLKGTVSSIPEREDILPDINENLVVEYYSK